jgi:RNA polymerase sigma factor (sigma-70 family)
MSLTNEELVLSYQGGNDDALLDLWLQNTGFVNRELRRYQWHPDVAWKNSGMIKKEVSRYRCNQPGVYSPVAVCRPYDLQDLEQAAFIGLMLAARTFKTELQYSFLTILHYYIKREVRLTLGLRWTPPTKMDRWLLENYGIPHEQPKVPHVASLDAPISDDADTKLLDMVACDTNPDMDEVAARSYECDVVRREVNGMKNKRAQRVIKLHYFEGIPIRIISEKVLRRSRQRVQALEREGIRDLRRNKRMLALVRDDLDNLTPFYARRGVGGFVTTSSSVVESAVLRREEIQERCVARL